MVSDCGMGLYCCVLESNNCCDALSRGLFLLMLYRFVYEVGFLKFFVGSIQPSQVRHV